MLHGDAAHLRQILVNLISNAIKFTEDGSVVIQAVYARRRPAIASQLRFSVRDTGIGIPLEARERLFEAFEQVDTGLPAATAAPGWAPRSPRT